MQRSNGHTPKILSNFPVKCPGRGGGWSFDLIGAKYDYLNKDMLLCWLECNIALYTSHTAFYRHHKKTYQEETYHLDLLRYISASHFWENSRTILILHQSIKKQDLAIKYCELENPNWNHKISLLFSMCIAWSSQTCDEDTQILWF